MSPLQTAYSWIMCFNPFCQPSPFDAALAITHAIYALRSLFLQSVLRYRLVSSFHPPGLPRVFLEGQGQCLQTVGFCLSGNVMSPSLLKGNFTRYRILVDNFLKFKHYDYSSPLYSGLPSFRWESCWRCFCESLARGHLLLRCCFQDSLWLFKLDYNVILLWVFLSSSYLEFIKFLGCLYSCCLPDLGSFRPLLLPILSLSLSLSPLLLDSHSAKVWSLRLRFFPSIFFSSSDSESSIILSSSSLILSSTCSNLLSNPSSELFVSVNVLFSSRTFFF